MLIHNISQLLTLNGGPQRGKDLGRLGIIEQGAVLMRGDTIVAVGPQDELITKYPDEQRMDANGKVMLPGFVDPHTHLVWAGDRAVEFEMRLEGRTYLEILAAGGGIISTVKATRQCEYDDLYAQTRARARTMLRYGTTTAEAKTGYGLELKSELDQLKILLIWMTKVRWKSFPLFYPRMLSRLNIRQP
jgi:imidazolonepropionase